MVGDFGRFRVRSKNDPYWGLNSAAIDAICQACASYGLNVPFPFCFCCGLQREGRSPT